MIYPYTVNSFFHYAYEHESFFKQNGNRILYKKGQALVRPEDDNPWIYYLASGLVEVSFAFSTGDERLIGYFVPGHTFAQSGSFYQDEGGGLEFLATVPVETYRIPRDVFFSMLRKDAGFSYDYIQTLLKNQLFLIDRIVYQGEVTVYRKTLRWLLLMAKYYCDETNDNQYRIAVPLTHDTVGRFLHVTRESASKTLKRLAQDGLVSVEKKRITILDKAAIEAKLLEF